MNKNDFEEAWIRRAGNPKEMAALRDRINRKMRNKTYRRAALEKALLIALMILLIVWILY